MLVCMLSLSDSICSGGGGTDGGDGRSGLDLLRDKDGKSDESSRYRTRLAGRDWVKENQEKDKIGSKPDKNGKRVEAGKSLKQLQWIKEKNRRKRKKNGQKRIQ
nr:hypothetical protein [Tanacetum cinerariifolium]